MGNFIRTLLASGAVVFGSVVFAQGTAEPPTLAASKLPGLVAKLKQGGYNLFFRHLDTRLDQEDQQPVDLNDCKAQRNLSEEGRSRGKMIGQAFRKARIPVGEVVSSPFCRTQDTARLIFGKTSTDADLFFAIALTDAGKKQKGMALRRLLATPPAAGTNNVYVSHTANLQEAIGHWPKPEGVAYVIRPDGQGGLAVVGRITPDAWAALLK